MRAAPLSKGRSRLRLLRLLVLPWLLLLTPCSAFADDAGVCLDDAGSACDAGTPVPLACDGGLCDTTNGAGCSLAPKPTGLSWMLLGVAALAGVLARRWFSRGSTGTERSQ
jgi:hypothetical protein